MITRELLILNHNLHSYGVDIYTSYSPYKRCITRNKSPYHKRVVLNAVKLGIWRCAPGASCNISRLVAVYTKITFAYATMVSTFSQIAAIICPIPPARAVDNSMEIGFGAKMPLWLFGFLY